MSSLAVRDRIPELMDDPNVDPVEHRRALAGLARINWWSRSDAILWPVLASIAQENPGRTIRVLDVATGAGDVPIKLWRRAKAAALPVAISGCDLSPTAVAIAAENAGKERADLEFFVHDVLLDPIPGRYDLVTCSLFLHHLSSEEATIVLQRMRDAADAVAVNDLARSRTGFSLAWIGTRLLSRSKIVHFDGPASVRSAFTADEAVALAEQAGLQGATAVSRWPCRFLMTWSRT